MVNPTRHRPPQVTGRNVTPKDIAEGVPVPKDAWNAPGVRDDVPRMFNLRLPEPYWMKLKYLTQDTPMSMHEYCMKVLLAQIDKDIAKKGLTP